MNRHARARQKLKPPAAPAAGQEAETSGHRSNERGTLIIDRVFPGVGRIKRASGTRDPIALDQLNAILTELHAAGRHDILDGIRVGTVPLAVLVKVKQESGVNGVAALLQGPSGTAPTSGVDASPPPRKVPPREVVSESVWKAWVERTKNVNTKRMRALAWRYLKSQLPDEATIADLKPALLDLRDEMMETPASFNRTRACVMRFVRERVTRADGEYLLIAAVDKLKEDAGERVGLKIEQALDIRAALSPNAASAWWSLVTTGMRPGELWQEELAYWTQTADFVDVNGTKNKTSKRITVKVQEVAAPKLTVRALNEELRAFNITAHVGRYTFRTIAVEAGVPEIRIKQYQGHALADSHRYGRVKLTDWVVEDSARLRRYIAERTAQWEVARSRTDAAPTCAPETR